MGASVHVNVGGLTPLHWLCLQSRGCKIEKIIYLTFFTRAKKYLCVK